jgi:hypothetical protein
LPIIASNGGVKRDEMVTILQKKSVVILKQLRDQAIFLFKSSMRLYLILVNFMTYVGEPSRVDRERMGWYAVLFFIVFTALAYLLFREYQKDYH